MNILNIRKFFSYRDVRLNKYVALLGEIAAAEELLAYHKRKRAKIDHTSDWWGWAYTNEAIKDLTVEIANLTARANACRPDDWYDLGQAHTTED